MAKERPKIEFEGANKAPKVTLKKTWILLRIGNFIVLVILLSAWALYKWITGQ